MPREYVYVWHVYCMLWSTLCNDAVNVLAANVTVDCVAQRGQRDQHAVLTLAVTLCCELPMLAHTTGGEMLLAVRV
jgi:hypothetical protein